MSVLKFKPKDCYIYTDIKGNKYWWNTELSDEEMKSRGYDCVGFRRNGVDEEYEPVEVITNHSKAFEEIRRAIDPLRSGWHNFTITKDAWGKL